MRNIDEHDIRKARIEDEMISHADDLAQENRLLREELERLHALTHKDGQCQTHTCRVWKALHHEALKEE